MESFVPKPVPLPESSSKRRTRKSPETSSAAGFCIQKKRITTATHTAGAAKHPLIFYARRSWYIRTTAYAPQMIEQNKNIGWHPPEMGEGRFGNWLEENKTGRYHGTATGVRPFRFGFVKLAENSVPSGASRNSATWATISPTHWIYTSLTWIG